MNSIPSTVGFASLIPFQSGDTVGKHTEAIAQAEAESAVTSGIRRALYQLQSAACELPEVDCPLQHVFAPGVYARTIFIPAGTVIIGKIHKHAHLNILSQGHVTVVTESGGRKDLYGPMTMTSEPGTKRAVYAHIDTTWTTIHLVTSTDLGVIEEEIIAKTYAEYEQFLLSGESTMSKIEVAL